MPSNMHIIFMGWSSLEHICHNTHVKPQKMLHDCLRGCVSLNDLTRLGTRI
jgi:hypothetical protein